MADSNLNENAATASGEIIQLVTFTLLEEEYGLPILDVREIIRMVDITPVPHAPSFVEGVINLRGQIIPVIDLRKRFELNNKDINTETRIVVVEVQETIVGLIVDSVSEVLRIDSSTIAPPPGLVTKGIGSQYLQGITNLEDRMVILVDIQRVFNKKEVDGLVGLDAS